MGRFYHPSKQYKYIYILTIQLWQYDRSLFQHLKLDKIFSLNQILLLLQESILLDRVIYSCCFERTVKLEICKYLVFCHCSKYYLVIIFSNISTAFIYQNNIRANLLRERVLNYSTKADLWTCKWYDNELLTNIHPKNSLLNIAYWHIFRLRNYSRLVSIRACFKSFCIFLCDDTECPNLLVLFFLISNHSIRWNTKSNSQNI